MIWYYFSYIFIKDLLFFNFRILQYLLPILGLIIRFLQSDLNVQFLIIPFVM